MTRVVQRKLVVTADTRTMEDGARVVERFGKSVTAAAVDLKKMTSQAIDPNGFRQLTAGMKSATDQARDMMAATRGMAGAAHDASADLIRLHKETLKQAEAEQKLALSEERLAKSLRMRFEDGYSGAVKYAQVEAQVARAIEARKLTVEQGNTVLAGARDRFKQMSAEVEGANDNIGLASHQVSSLRSQAIDMGTMLAGGASPFMILSSQAGQVYEALAGGKGGVKGALAAIGSNIAGFARAIPVAGYAVAGVSAAVAALWYVTSGPKAREAEESVKTFEDAVKRLRPQWDEAADAAENYYERAKNKGGGGGGGSRPAALLDTNADIRQLRKDFSAQVNDLDTSDKLSGRILRPFAGSVSDARREISAVYTELRKGQTTAANAAAVMERIRLDPNAEIHARAFADEIRRALGPVVDLEQRIQALNNAAAQLAAPKGTTGRIDPVQDVFDTRFGDRDTAMDGLRDGLKSQRDELGKADEAAKSYTKSVEDQRRSVAGSVQDLQRQIDYFGKSEGAQAAARMQADLLAEAERNAAEAKQKGVDPKLLDFIKSQSDEYGRLTDRLKTLNEEEAKRKRLSEFDDDLNFRTAQLGRTDIEQRVASQMKAAGLAYGAPADAGREAMLRLIETMETARTKTDELGDGFRDAFGGVVDMLMRGGNAMDALMDGFAAFGSPLGDLNALFEENEE